LHTCTSSDLGYVLNEDAFVFHSANFRERVVNEYFRQVGIENIFGLIKQQEKIKEYLKLTSLEDGDEGYVLNDLADLRNDVAHWPCATC
jgi:hypothetical protein